MGNLEKKMFWFLVLSFLLFFLGELMCNKLRFVQGLVSECKVM